MSNTELSMGGSLWNNVLENQTPKLLQNALQSMQIGLWDWNFTEQTVFTNARFHTMTGHQPCEGAICDVDYSSRVHPLDCEAFQQAIANVHQASQEQYEAVFRLKCADGSYRWIHSTGTVTERNPQGSALRIVGYNRDIDSQKRTEIALQALNSFDNKGNEREVITRFCNEISSIFDSPYVAVVQLIEKDGAAWARIIGGVNFGDSVCDIDYPLEGTPCQKALQERSFVSGADFRTSFPNAEYLKPADTSDYAGICLHDRLGTPVALLTIATDTSWNESLDMTGLLKLIGSRTELELQRIDVNAELHQARMIAERAELTKTEFLNNMSHEIRNPMTAILGYSDLLGTDGDFLNDQDRSAYAINAIKKSSLHLLQVANDILDVTNIDAGKMIIEPVKMNPILLIEETCEDLRVRAAGKKVEFSIQYQGKIPEQIVSDPYRVRQTLHNLVENAVNFTDQGSVTVAVSYDGNSAVDGMMNINIIDTGIGLSPDQQILIETYQPFVQLDGSSTRNHEGIGLGLRIANSLVSILGGKLEIVSEKGKGSRFSFNFSTGYHDDAKMLNKTEIEALVNPKDTSADQSHQTKNKKPLSGKRILIAEDGLENQKLISYHLSKAGADVMVAENGLIAIETIEKTDEPFHVIFMDMQMPVLDGYSATRKLREQGYDQPIVALTANAMDGDRLKCIVAGCDDYISKPINRKKLVEMCEGFINSPVSIGQHF